MRRAFPPGISESVMTVMNAGAYLFYVWPVEPAQRRVSVGPCGCFRIRKTLQQISTASLNLRSKHGQRKKHEKHTYELCMYRLTLQIPTKKW